MSNPQTSGFITRDWSSNPLISLQTQTPSWLIHQFLVILKISHQLTIPWTATSIKGGIHIEVQVFFHLNHFPFCKVALIGNSYEKLGLEKHVLQQQLLMQNSWPLERERLCTQTKQPSSSLRSLIALHQLKIWDSLAHVCTFHSIPSPGAQLSLSCLAYSWSACSSSQTCTETW